MGHDGLIDERGEADEEELFAVGRDDAVTPFFFLHADTASCCKNLFVSSVSKPATTFEEVVGARMPKSDETKFMT